MEFVRRHDLDPDPDRGLDSQQQGFLQHRDVRTVHQEPPGVRRWRHGGRRGVPPGDFFYIDVSLRAPLNAYKAYLAGGLLRRAGCRIRPRERVPGAADRAIQAGLALLVTAFEGRGSRARALQEAAALLGCGSRGPPLSAARGHLR